MLIDFEKSGGLVPAIAQDHQTGEVLMMAWMNRDAFDETVRTKRAVYFSRSRLRARMKASAIRRWCASAKPQAAWKSSMTQPLRLGIPAGSLQEATAELFRSAGFKITFQSRSYYPSIDDPEIHCTLIRAQEMPRYVQDGSLDCGLTGYDWVLENDAKIVELAELVFSKVSKRPVRWVLAVPNDSPVQSVKDLRGKRIATEVVSLTRRWLAQHSVEAQVEFSLRATEAKPPRLADAIVEVTETGSSL